MINFIKNLTERVYSENISNCLEKIREDKEILFQKIKNSTDKKYGIYKIKENFYVILLPSNGSYSFSSILSGAYIPPNNIEIKDEIGKRYGEKIDENAHVIILFLDELNKLEIAFVHEEGHKLFFEKYQGNIEKIKDMLLKILNDKENLKDNEKIYKIKMKIDEINEKAIVDSEAYSIIIELYYIALLLKNREISKNVAKNYFLSFISTYSFLNKNSLKRIGNEKELIKIINEIFINEEKVVNKLVNKLEIAWKKINREWSKISKELSKLEKELIKLI